MSYENWAIKNLISKNICSRTPLVDIYTPVTSTTLKTDNCVPDSIINKMISMNPLPLLITNG